MKTIRKKSNILSNMEEFGINRIFEKLNEEYKRTVVDSDCDFEVSVVVVKEEEYKKITGYKPINIHFYESYRCYHEYDCCGCMSSQSIDVINNRNGFVSIFFTTNFNY